METARTVTNFLSNLIWSKPDFSPLMIFLLFFIGKTVLLEVG